jgi:hypothetical protein
MRIGVALALWGAAALSGISGCSEHTYSSAPRTGAGVAEPQAQTPLTARDRAEELVLAAQIQIRDLEDMRAASTDLATSEAVDRQIVTVSRYRDAVLADLGDPQSTRLDSDVSYLQRAMETASAAHPQAPELPPIERQDTPPGGAEALPPAR